MNNTSNSNLINDKNRSSYLDQNDEFMSDYLDQISFEEHLDIIDGPVNYRFQMVRNFIETCRYFGVYYEDMDDEEFHYEDMDDDDMDDDDEFDWNGFNSEGIHRNGTRYDDEGFDCFGYDPNGYDRHHRDEWGDLDPYHEMLRQAEEERWRRYYGITEIPEQNDFDSLW